MSRASIWIYRAVLSFLALSILAAILFYWIFSRSVPEYEARLAQPYLDQEIEILRDRNAIPHIYAQDMNGAIFALGYTHAQDRLWQMIRWRRMLGGRMSELYGEGWLEWDRLMRALNLEQASEESYAKLPAQDQAWLEAYANGVNTYLEEINKGARGAGAPEFLLYGRKLALWRPQDSVALFKFMALQSTHQAYNEVVYTQILATHPDEMDILFYPDFNAQYLAPKGFNIASGTTISIKGSATSTGEALLAGDMQTLLESPSTWYIAHFTTPQNDIIGVGLAGVPAFLFGRSNHFAWTSNLANLDDQDLVVLEPVPDQDWSYYDGDKPALMRVENVEISVKGRKESEIFTRKATTYGPVLPKDTPWKTAQITPEGYDIALAWTGASKEDQSLTRWLHMMNAPSLPEAKAALESYTTPAMVLSFSAPNGVTDSMLIGKTPNRNQKNPTKGRYPVLASTGYAGFTLAPPPVLAPKSTPVQSFSNTPLKELGPTYSEFWGGHYRGLRVESLLGTRRVHSAKGLEDAQTDTIAEDARRLLPLMAYEFWFDPNEKGQRKEVLDLLANWNGRLDSLGSEALIYMEWIRAFHELVFYDDLGEQLELLGAPDPYRLEYLLKNDSAAARLCDRRLTPEKETCRTLASIALDQAIENLTRLYGPSIEGWRYGTANKSRHLGSFEKIFPLSLLSTLLHDASGGPETLYTAYQTGTPEPLNIATSMRMLVDFANIHNPKFIISTGQSGHFLSPYYDDQNALWRAGEYLTIDTRPDIVEKNHIARTVITYAP